LVIISMKLLILLLEMEKMFLLIYIRNILNKLFIYYIENFILFHNFIFRSLPFERYAKYYIIIRFVFLSFFLQNEFSLIITSL
jgi:hypothetical protein